MHVRFDASASASARLSDHAPAAFDLAQRPDHAEGAPFDRQPFGNLGHIFQVRNAAGDYELYFESRIGETGLVWTNRGRPLDMRSDYSYTVDFPIPRQRGTPFAERLNEVARELDQRARDAMADPDRPLSENPFVRFANGAAGAARAFLGDPVAGLAGMAPYFAISPTMFQDPAALGVAREIGRAASGAVDTTLDSWLTALGFEVDSPAFDFGLNMGRIASLLAGLYGLGEGALRLVRINHQVQVAARNGHVLASFENLSRARIGDVARFIDRLTPEEVAGFDPSMLDAMRRGLARHSGDATARAALSRLDDLTAGRIVVRGAGDGGAGAGSGSEAQAPIVPRLPPADGEPITFGPYPGTPRGGGGGVTDRTGRASPQRDASSDIARRAREAAEADAARNAALRQAADQHPVPTGYDVSIARPLENWDVAGRVASQHNASAHPRDIVVRVPLERQLGPDDSLREIALLRGDAIALQEQIGRFVEAGTMTPDFDLAGAARQVGINWEAARLAAAEMRVRAVALDHPLTIAGYTTFAMPDAARAERESLQWNRSTPSEGMVALPLVIMREIADGAGGTIPVRSHEVWFGPPERARGAIEALAAQRRLAGDQSLAHILARAGLSDSFAAREQAGLDLRAAQIEMEQPTRFDGVDVGIQPSREAAISAVLDHNAEARPGLDPQWLYLPLENRITGPGLPPDARGRVHAIYANASFDQLEAFYQRMRETGRIGPDVSFDRLLREAGITRRFAAARQQEADDRAQTPMREETGIAPSHPDNPGEAAHFPPPVRVAAEALTISREINLEEPGEIIDFVRDRRLDAWEGDGLDDVDPDALDAAAATLYALDFSSPGGIGFFDDDLRMAMDAIRRAGGRAFPAPVAPGEPGYDAMPRAIDYGLPDRGYVYAGIDDAGHPVWRGEDGRHVGPFAREPVGAFANPVRDSGPAPIRFPFNPTAPGPLVPLAPPGALAGYDPIMTAPVTREDLAPQSRDMLDTLIGMIRDAGFDLRGGLNVSIRDPFAGLQVLRSTGAVGLDTLRALNARRGAIIEAAASGDVRTLLDIFAHALGVGARIGEGLHEPQLVRLALQELIGLRGLGINSALQWKASALEGYAERSFLGEESPFRFTPDTETLALERQEPGFAEIEGHLALDVTPLPPEEAAGAVDIFGNSDSDLYRLNADLRIGKTMFEFYTPALEIGPLGLPGAEYREELAEELIIPAGSILPREFVAVIDRAVGDGRFSMRFQTLYTEAPDEQAELFRQINEGLVSGEPLAGQPGFLEEFGAQNVEATHNPGFRARLSAPPGRIPGGRDTIDANFLPSEHFVSWLVGLVTGGAVHLPMDRAVPGEFDVAARFAPDVLHGYADKVRIKLNLGPSTSFGDIVGLRTAFYLVRESRPEARTALMRSHDSATVTFEDRSAEQRAIDVPVWLSMMLGHAVAPGQVEAALGLQPLPPGGIVIPPGGSASLRDLLQRAWHAGGPEEREAAAGFIADHLAGPEPDFVDGHTLMPELKDELIEVLYRIAKPQNALAQPEQANPPPSAP
ncbi:hypothetical protein [Saliniramus sp.]|uniref:hypothetical protein n=1 Tax=Saliniramus sp. TaxID=2986772 RepID=UPI002B92881B|nr:hypothetical protein [Saliniramus sp.]HMB11842.1 hypothetical protein [Saliniramus sp.]